LLPSEAGQKISVRHHRVNLYHLSGNQDMAKSRRIYRSSRMICTWRAGHAHSDLLGLLTMARWRAPPWQLARCERVIIVFSFHCHRRLQLTDFTATRILRQYPMILSICTASHLGRISLNWKHYVLCTAIINMFSILYTTIFTVVAHSLHQVWLNQCQK
jgi:hypothetical protein